MRKERACNALMTFCTTLACSKIDNVFTKKRLSNNAKLLGSLWFYPEVCYAQLTSPKKRQKNR